MTVEENVSTFTPYFPSGGLSDRLVRNPLPETDKVRTWPAQNWMLIQYLILRGLGWWGGQSVEGGVVEFCCIGALKQRSERSKRNEKQREQAWGMNAIA